MTTSPNDRLRAWCDDRALAFDPWEIAPWEATDDTCPWPCQTGGATSWPRARALRARIIEELRLNDE
jgi:hypothetical protein